MINENVLALEVVKREGGKIGLSIGQVKEVIKLTLKRLGKHKASEIMALVEKHK
ncbi:hypothetical protein CCP3SC1AL1_110028 [Gammaproteobacteria bacterium]